MSLIRLWKLVLLGVLPQSLLGCGTFLTKEVVKEYVYVQKPVPEQLLDRCGGSPPILGDNSDLVRAYLELRQALEGCNQDKQSLKEYYGND